MDLDNYNLNDYTNSSVLSQRCLSDSSCKVMHD